MNFLGKLNIKQYPKNALFSQNIEHQLKCKQPPRIFLRRMPIFVAQKMQAQQKAYRSEMIFNKIRRLGQPKSRNKAKSTRFLCIIQCQKE
jgi:hypothetical protein